MLALCEANGFAYDPRPIFECSIRYRMDVEVAEYLVEHALLEPSDSQLVAAYQLCTRSDNTRLLSVMEEHVPILERLDALVGDEDGDLADDARWPRVREALLLGRKNRMRRSKEWQSAVGELVPYEFIAECVAPFVFGE